MKLIGIATISSNCNFYDLHPAFGTVSPRELAEKTMRQILPYVDVVIGNEEDASEVLGIRAGESDVESGKLDIERYPQVARKIVEQFTKNDFVNRSVPKAGQCRITSPATMEKGCLNE